jgi:hypothetical protein
MYREVTKWVLWFTSGALLVIVIYPSVAAEIVIPVPATKRIERVTEPPSSKL